VTGIALIRVAMDRHQPGIGLIPAESVIKMTTLSTGALKISATFDIATQHSCRDTLRNHINKPCEWL
jgi:hypothetical protein